MLLSYGVEWVQNKVNSEAHVRQLSTDASKAGLPRYPDATWTSLAAFLHSDIQINTTTKVQAGARYNTYHIDAQLETQIA